MESSPGGITAALAQVRESLGHGTYRNAYEASNSYQANIERLAAVDAAVAAALRGDRARIGVALAAVPEATLHAWQGSAQELRAAWDAKFAASASGGGGSVGGGGGDAGGGDSARADWLRQLQAEDAAGLEAEAAQRERGRGKRASPVPAVGKHKAKGKGREDHDGSGSDGGEQQHHEGRKEKKENNKKKQQQQQQLAQPVPTPQTTQRDAKAHSHHNAGMGERGSSLCNLMHPQSTFSLDSETRDDVDTLSPDTKRVVAMLDAGDHASRPAATTGGCELHTFATHKGCWFAALPPSVLVPPVLAPAAAASKTDTASASRLPTCRLRSIENTPLVEILFTTGVSRDVATRTTAPNATGAKTRGGKPPVPTPQQAQRTEVDPDTPMPAVTLCAVTAYRVVVAALLQRPPPPDTATATTTGSPTTASSTVSPTVALTQRHGAARSPPPEARAAAADDAGGADDDEGDDEFGIQETTSDIGEDEPPLGAAAPRNALARGADNAADDDDDDGYGVEALRGLASVLVSQHARDEEAAEDASALGIHSRGRDLPTEIFAPLTQWLGASAAPWVVLMCHGGYFAGCVFEHMRPVVHKAFHRYVVRKKAGGKQSSHDKSGGSMSSAGGQIRRHHELKWKGTVREILLAWKDYIDRAVAVLYVAPGPDNRGILTDFSDLPASLVLSSSFPNREAKSPINLRDPRVRSVPLTTHRPTFNEVCRIFEEVATVTIRYKELPGNTVG